MATVHAGRFSADQGADGKVLFLIGMRINRVWQFWKWLPVFTAMPRMIAELMKNRDLGLVGRPRTFVSGRVVLVWQYWSSFEQLEAYARDNTRAHLPAWRAFNRSIRDNGSVGIFHETYAVSAGAYETIYGNMPPFGLGKVAGLIPATGKRNEARSRMKAASEG